MPIPILHFVYTERKLATGSTYMRCMQMHDALKQAFPDKIDARLLAMPERRDGFAAQERWALSQPGGGVYFFSKTSVRALTSFAARLLKLRSRGILFDHVDEPADRLRLELADRHICCSHAQFLSFRAMAPDIASKARLVLHATDLRLEQTAPAQQSRFAPVYLGDPENTAIPDALRSEVEVLSALDRDEFAAQIPRLPEFNLHFAARAFRAGQSGAAKPFLKGFTAARLGANILLPRDVEDAAHYLGPDYPYFYDEDEGPVSAFRRARADFGGPIWNRARDRMLAISEVARPGVVAKQLLDVVRELR